MKTRIFLVINAVLQLQVCVLAQNWSSNSEMLHTIHGIPKPRPEPQKIENINGAPATSTPFVSTTTNGDDTVTYRTHNFPQRSYNGYSQNRPIPRHYPKPQRVTSYPTSDTQTANTELTQPSPAPTPMTLPARSFYPQIPPQKPSDEVIPLEPRSEPLPAIETTNSEQPFLTSTLPISSSTTFPIIEPNIPQEISVSTTQEPLEMTPEDFISTPIFSSTTEQIPLYEKQTTPVWNTQNPRTNIARYSATPSQQFTKRFTQKSYANPPDYSAYRRTSNIALDQGPSDLECTGNNYYTATGNCELFVECKRNFATKYLCPDGLYFNPNIEWPNYPCSYPSEVKCDGRPAIRQAISTSSCPRQYGYFATENSDCSRYKMCQKGRAVIMNCPSGLVFNSESSSCDWPANVPSCNNPTVFSGFSCPSPPPQSNTDEGPEDIITNHRYGNSCTQYIACIDKQQVVVRL